MTTLTDTHYGFNLTADLSEDDHFQLTKDETVRVDVKFAVALPNTINVVVYAEFESLLEIDRNRNIIFDYSS